MQISELYRQRANECERMAVEKPCESEYLQEAAKTWRWLAEAADDLSATAKSVH